MRTAFVETITQLAEQDRRIWLLTGDLGYSVLGEFAERFPRRFVNVGVAEQDMTGVAVGLAMSGNVVFTYSIANFPTLRCLEQIRNDACFHEADVKIVAVGGGFTYGAQGHTHHAVEDLAIMRALPGMTVIAPGDPVETRLATAAIAKRPGPCYLRLGRAGEPVIHPTPPDFWVGKAITVRQGLDVTLIATGGILYNTLRAAELLERAGIQARVLSMHTVKPLDEEAVLAAGRESGRIVSIEEHSVIGGLGSAIAEVLALSGSGPVAFARLGIADTCLLQTGSQEYLRKAHSLSVEGIAGAARLVLTR
jgi:transketolase